VRRSWAGLGKRVVLRDDNLQTKAGLKFGGSGNEKDEDEEGIDDVALTTESLNPKNAGKQHGRTAVLDQGTTFEFMFYV
jgi:hypothetical protein